MAERIITMRDALYDGLVANNTPGDWNHIKKQIGWFLLLCSAPVISKTDVEMWSFAPGMFSFTGLTTPQTVALAQKAHIYVCFLPSDEKSSIKD